MSRRKLSHQQIQRVGDQSKQRDDLLTGRVVARYGKKAQVYNDAGKELRLLIPGKLHGATRGDDIVVGDLVLYKPHDNHDSDGVIQARNEPKTLLVRFPRGTTRPKNVAANVTQLAIVIAPKPAVTSLIIDEYLLAAAAYNLQPIIIANKSDLIDSQLPEYQQLLADYKTLGVEIIQVSANPDKTIVDSHNLINIATLKTYLKNHTSVFMGTSGVGKSSLLNTLVGEEIAHTNIISATADLGQHTTTTARLYFLPEAIEIIDAPGIREFRLDQVSQQALKLSYDELHQLPCKFNNCSHKREPGCAVTAQLANKPTALFTWRYNNYLSLYNDLVEGLRE